MEMPLRKRSIWRSHSLLTQLSWATYSVFALLILAGSAALRFMMPQTPIIDPDFCGYLGPAISALTGHGFAHMQGRDTLYPSFVWLILRLFGDLRALGAIQHCFGLATCALILLACHRGFPLLRQVKQPIWPPFIALPAAFVYGISEASIYFEATVRPEALFPFFAALSICLNIEMVRWLRSEPSSRGAWLGAAQIFASVILYKLKPSFGFDLLFANILVIASLFSRKLSLRNKVIMTTASGCLIGVLLLLPEAVLQRKDPESMVFLSDTLVTMHAGLVRDQLAEDLSRNAPSPFDQEIRRKLLARLDELLPQSKLPENKPFAALGFNPDYLMYTHNIFEGVTGSSASEMALRRHLGFYLYRRAFLHQPAKMIQKIVRQLAVFYRFGPISEKRWRPRDIGFHRVGKRTEEDVYARNAFLYPKIPPNITRPDFQIGARFVADSQTLANARIAIDQPGICTSVQSVLERLYLPVLIAAAVLGVWILAKRGGRDSEGVWLVMLLFSYNFGNNLTIAVVHSLSVTRYIATELVFTILSATFGIVFVINVGERLLHEALKKRIQIGSPLQQAHPEAERDGSNDAPKRP